jgi:hypothetical protein
VFDAFNYYIKGYINECSPAVLKIFYDGMCTINAIKIGRKMKLLHNYIRCKDYRI